MRIVQVISCILLCLVRPGSLPIVQAQPEIREGHYYADFSNDSLPAGWKPSMPGYHASVSDGAMELSIAKLAASDHYTLGNLHVKDFDLRPYVTIRYRSADSLHTGVSIFGMQDPIPASEVFTLPACEGWKDYTFNLSALASEAWGYDLDSIQLVFQPGNPEYSGSIGLEEIMIGDSLHGKTFRVGLVQSDPFSVDLGKDTTIRQSSTLVLDAGIPGKIYLWNTGETTRSITVDTSGIYWVRIIGENNCTVSDTLDVAFDILDKVPGQGDHAEFQIYPNPAVATVQLEVAEDLKGSVMLIWTVSGIVMDSFTISAGRSSIDISRYPPGFYIVGIPGKSTQQKFIKE